MENQLGSLAPAWTFEKLSRIVSCIQSLDHFSPGTLRAPTLTPPPPPPTPLLSSIGAKKKLPTSLITPHPDRNRSGSVGLWGGGVGGWVVVWGGKKKHSSPIMYFCITPWDNDGTVSSHRCSVGYPWTMCWSPFVSSLFFSPDTISFHTYLFWNK